MHKVLCVIPCRKGSKRLPDKTIKKFRGKPLIHHTLEQAKQLFNLDQIIINTDYTHKELDIDEGWNIFERPKDLCGDNITTEQLLRNMLLDYPECEMIVLLQLTSPTRKIDTIKRVIRMAYSTKQNTRTELKKGPDGQVYVWWANKEWGNWNPIYIFDYEPDIDTQLDFEIAEILHESI